MRKRVKKEEVANGIRGRGVGGGVGADGCSREEEVGGEERRKES